MRFLPREEAAKRIFDKSDFKKNLSEKSDDTETVEFESAWWEDCARVQLDKVLKWVEKNAKCDCTVKIEVEDAELFLEDFEKFLSKAGKSKHGWELKIRIHNDKYDDPDDKYDDRKFIDSVKKLNKPAFRYGVEAKKVKKEGETYISVTVKQKEWRERVEDSGTLTLTEEDVAKGNLFKILSDVLAINRDGKSATKIMNLSLPFNPALYEDAWKGTSLSADKDPTFRLRDALAILLEKKDFDFETLTLTSAEGLDPNAFEKALNETLKARNINRLISVSPEGVITFKKHNMPMPAFESQDQAITTSFDNKNKGVEQSMLTLKWTDEWTKWFEDPTTDFGTFIEALAEHPEIRCVDFSLMPKDGVGHKKYLTENAVNKLLKVNGVYFVCRYMPDNTAGSLKDWGKWGQSYGLSFVKKASGLIATWRSYGKKDNRIDQKDGGWFTVYSKDRYVVSKTEENGKKRLLWNKATLTGILKTKPTVWNIRYALASFSGRANREVLTKGGYNNLQTIDATTGKNLMPYKPIDVIDFTIGDPKGRFKVGKKEYTWAGVHGSVGDEYFAWAIDAPQSVPVAWTKDAFKETLEADSKAEPGKKLPAAKRRELKEQLRIAELLYSDGEVKERIKQWNQENTKPYKRTEKIYGGDNKDVFNTQEVSTNVIKGLQLAENVGFMEQWELINGEGPAAWKEADKRKLIGAVLGKQPFSQLTLPALLERLWHQWKPEMSGEFKEQWNKEHKNDKNEIKGKFPLLDSGYSDNQWYDINHNWDQKFKTSLAVQLKFVELLDLLEQCPANAKKTFTDKWNGEYQGCKCYALDAKLTPVAQTANIMKWKKCTHKNASLEEAKNSLWTRLSRLDYLMNFMAQWSEEERKTFIEGWNDKHENAKLLPDAKPFEQFQGVFKWENGSDLRDELEKQVMLIEESRTVEGLREVHKVWLEQKELFMRYMRCIQRVSILAYEDCISDKQRQSLVKSDWIVKPYLRKGKPYQKEGRNVVEIKYNLHSRSAWSEEEAKDVFGTDKKKAEDRAFTVASDVFEAPAGRFAPKEEFTNPAEKLEAREVWGEEGMQNGLSDIDVPTMKKGKDAFHFNPKGGLRSRYYTLPFGEFLELLKNAKEDLAKLDLTKFEDKGAKVSLDEFLKHPFWTFTVPINRLRELKKAEKMIWIKILKTKENAVTFIVFPQLKFQRAEEKEGNSLKWYLNNNKEYRDFADRYFDAFKQQLEGFVRGNHPLVISLEKSGYPKAFDDKANFKAFFDTKTFFGVGFEFKAGTDFAENFEAYNENKEDVKHTLEWFQESKTTCPAIYVRPEKWQQPSTPEESEKWLNESFSGISRLRILKESLKREVNRILAGKSEPGDEDKKRKRQKAVEALMKAIDDLTSEDWQVVIGIERVENRYEVATKDGEPILLLDKSASILKDREADFALRLCNGFPLLEEQREAFCKFVEWATQQLCQYWNREGQSSPYIKTVLRFFLSWPDMILYDLLHWQTDRSVEISITWMESWNFTFGQLMKKYLEKNEIKLLDGFFKEQPIKDTEEKIGEGTYRKTVKAWKERNNNALRNVTNREELERRFEMFIKSLKGFTDWDTVGGKIEDWEDYQLKRWEAYKDLTKADKDLPESLTTREAIRDAEKK